jgi:hypothetical protein
MKKLLISVLMVIPLFSVSVHAQDNATTDAKVTCKRPPLPPKDKDGKPLPPPKPQDGHPQPPMGKDGKPLPPPDGCLPPPPPAK